MTVPYPGWTTAQDSLKERAALYDLLASTAWAEKIAARAFRYMTVLGNGGTLYFAGNGGSAATAQHVAAEYVGRFARTRPGLRAIAMTTDTSILTAVGNDFGFEHVFQRQAYALLRPDDLLVLHSTSGNSLNLRMAADSFFHQTVFLLGGDGGVIGAASGVDALIVPCHNTALIQEVHLAIEHIICGIVENTLYAINS